jgi:hypothetical protein
MAKFEAVPVTEGGQRYFGYYDIQPFNGRQTHLLVLTPPFIDREPRAEDVLEIGLVELATRKYERLAETRAWNFQQGCFLHWHPAAPNDVILYNDRIDGRFVCVELNIQSGKSGHLPRAISAIDRAGKVATSLNFARLAVTRPGYGYEGLPDPFGEQLAPEDDGIWIMDLATGKHHLAFSYAQAVARHHTPAEVTGVKSWFNHNVISDDGARSTVLHRFVPPGAKSWHTTLFTVPTDGSQDVRKVIDSGMVSHFDWYQSSRILAWARHDGDPTARFWLADDTEGGRPAEIVAKEEWTRDGHCSYSSDYQWILNDSYPGGESRAQQLWLYRPADGTMVDLGAFPHEGPRTPVSIRCDLHPRFSRDDTMICFDSTHSGQRMTYVMDVSAVTKA